MKKALFLFLILFIIDCFPGFTDYLRTSTKNLSLIDNKTDMQDNYLYHYYKGNYLWCGAMNLAWNELNENILHEQLELNTNDKIALEMVNKLNNAVLNKNDLDEASYYVKSGYGQKTVDLINKESSEKFPDKSFKNLNLALQPTDIISYAYFLKQVEYLTQFKEKDVLFENEKVKGFHAPGINQQGNVKILKYWNNEKFIISLKLKYDNDELILAKGFDMTQPKAIVDKVSMINKDSLSKLNKDETFEMPKLQLEHRHEYTELIGKYLANKGFEEYVIDQMFENIKFDMDHKGARVENEAVIVCYASEPPVEETIKIRKFILDKPFWVIMKRKSSQNPYFLLGVNNTELMKKVKK